MSKTPNYDAKVKPILDELKPGARTCAITGETWRMTDEEIAVLRKFNVPPSKLAPMTRLKLLNTYFVIFDIWYNRHAETGKPVVSIAHPASSLHVLPDEEWFQKDFTENGREVDYARSVSDQIYELSRSQPIPATWNYIPAENSIAFISLGDQDSNFVLASQTKRTWYSMNAHDTEDSAEVNLSHHIRNSYNIVHSHNIFNGRWIRESLDCIDSSFLFDCRNCENCFGATNKRNKKFLFWNEQLSEGEWRDRVSKINLRSWAVRQEHERRFHDLVTNAVWPENWNINCDGCEGEYLYNSTNVRNAYYAVDGSQDMNYLTFGYGKGSRDSYCNVACMGSNDCYYGIGNNNSSKNKFTLAINSRCMNCEYCNTCYDCEYCFGCVGLRKKKFCILNKQYTEEEYWKELDKIKVKMLEDGEYGDVLPGKFSHQHWSGCGAYTVMGCSKEECLALGCADFEPGAEGAEGPAIDPNSIKSLDEIPDHLGDVQPGVPYFDAAFGRRFAYFKPELKLYEKLGVAPPRMHPTHRIQHDFAEMNYAVFEDVNCAKCSVSIRVGKNRNYPKRTIYCHACYLGYLETNG